MIIKNGLVFTENNTFVPMTVHTDSGLITKLQAPEASVSAADVFDAAGCFVKAPPITKKHNPAAAGSFAPI